MTNEIYIKFLYERLPKQNFTMETIIKYFPTVFKRKITSIDKDELFGMYKKITQKRPETYGTKTDNSYLNQIEENKMKFSDFLKKVIKEEFNKGPLRYRAGANLSSFDDPDFYKTPEYRAYDGGKYNFPPPTEKRKPNHPSYENADLGKEGTGLYDDHEPYGDFDSWLNSYFDEMGADPALGRESSNYEENLYGMPNSYEDEEEDDYMFEAKMRRRVGRPNKK